MNEKPALLSPPRAEPKLADQLAAAVLQHGYDVVLFAWTSYTVPMLKVSGEMLRASELAHAAQDHGLGPDDVHDAFALLAAIRASSNPHQAWIAGEIYRRNVQDAETMQAAFAADDPPPQKENGDGTQSGKKQ